MEKYNTNSYFLNSKYRDFNTSVFRGGGGGGAVTGENLSSADQSTLDLSCLLRIIIPINKGVIGLKNDDYQLSIIFLINKLAACQRVLMLSDQLVSKFQSF